MFQNLNALWHVDPLLGNDRETGNGSEDMTADTSMCVCVCVCVCV
jgi:hypothetical protein